MPTVTTVIIAIAAVKRSRVANTAAVTVPTAYGTTTITIAATATTSRTAIGPAIT